MKRQNYVPANELDENMFLFFNFIKKKINLIITKKKREGFILKNANFIRFYFNTNMKKTFLQTIILLINIFVHIKKIGEYSIHFLLVCKH
jgi:hypothetical protein